MKMKISEIKVNKRKRTLKLKRVGDLAESIKCLGLLNPITVNKEGNTLVCGYHRLEACKQLGRETIEVTMVSNKNPLITELQEIDENLIRSNGTKLEYADDLKRGKEIYEQLFPETKRGAAGRIAKREQKEFPYGHNDRLEKTASDKGSEEVKNEKVDQKRKPSYTKIIASKTGKSESAIKRELQIAENITPEVKEEIKDLPIADNKKKLIELSKKTPKQQKKAVQKMKGKKQTPKQQKTTKTAPEQTKQNVNTNQLQKTIQEQQEIIKQKDVQVQELQETITKQKQTIKQKDIQIQQLKKEIQDYEEDYAYVPIEEEQITPAKQIQTNQETEEYEYDTNNYIDNILLGFDEAAERGINKFTEQIEIDGPSM